MKYLWHLLNSIQIVETKSQKHVDDWGVELCAFVSGKLVHKKSFKKIEMRDLQLK